MEEDFTTMAVGEEDDNNQPPVVTLAVGEDEDGNMPPSTTTFAVGEEDDDNQPPVVTLAVGEDQDSDNEINPISEPINSENIVVELEQNMDQLYVNLENFTSLIEGI
jgi:hypothetical protein